MTVTIIKGADVARPSVTPLKSSILDHATVVTNGSFGLRNNMGMWPSYNCLDTLVPTPLCPDPFEGVKAFSTAEWIPGFEFAYQGGVQCRTVGLDRNDMKAEIVRVFSANEGKGIEMALLLNRFVATDSPADPDLPQWADPVDLTVANMPLLAALGALEGYAAANYAGVPTIHMPRAAAVILFALGALKDVDGKFFTKTGAKVAAGGGYDSDEVPTGDYDLYATGEVYIERGPEASVTDVFVLPGDGSGTGSGENGLMDNTVIGQVERTFRVAVDCFVAKATGSVAATSGGFGI